MVDGHRCEYVGWKMSPFHSMGEKFCSYLPPVPVTGIFPFDEVDVLEFKCFIVTFVKLIIRGLNSWKVSKYVYKFIFVHIILYICKFILNACSNLKWGTFLETTGSNQWKQQNKNNCWYYPL